MALNERFFAAVRSFYGGRLTQAQVVGLEAVEAALHKYGDGDLRKLAYIMATAHHETGGAFGPRVENLNYTTAARIAAVWPKRFTVASAAPYVRQPQKLANKVYGGRLGNTAPNDGWTYRGRGPGQLTGRAHYEWFGRELGVDLVGNPDLALDPKIGGSALVIGMVRGKFTGRKLADNVPDPIAARATINADANTRGASGQTFGQLIAGYAKVFEGALREGWQKGVAPVEPAADPPKPSTNWLTTLLAALAAFFMRRRKA